MEPNRSLIIIISATLFVAALLAVAIWVFYPERDAPMAADTSGEPFRFAGTMDLRADADASEDGIDEDRQTGLSGADPRDSISDIAIRFADDVVVPGPDGPTVIRAVPPSRDTPPAETAAGTESGTNRSSGTADRSVVAPSATQAGSTPGIAPRSGSTVQPQRVGVTTAANASGVQYWIQLFSTPNRDRIDTAQSRLDELSFGSRISTRSVEDVLYYRLRVGPYNNLHEAGKFLEWLSVIPDFGGAYISQVLPGRS